jgi:negative regulator of sigma E activity
MDFQQRLGDAGARAKAAEAQGDDAAAAVEWRRYRLIRDAARDPDDLLAEGIALSAQAIELAAATR